MSTQNTELEISVYMANDSFFSINFSFSCIRIMLFLCSAHIALKIIYHFNSDWIQVFSFVLCVYLFLHPAMEFKECADCRQCCCFFFPFYVCSISINRFVHYEFRIEKIILGIVIWNWIISMEWQCECYCYILIWPWMAFYWE